MQILSPHGHLTNVIPERMKPINSNWPGGSEVPKRAACRKGYILGKVDRYKDELRAKWIDRPTEIDR